MSRTADTLTARNTPDDGPSIIDNLRVSLEAAEQDLCFAQRWAAEAVLEDLDSLSLPEVVRRIARLRVKVLALLEMVSKGQPPITAEPFNAY